ncbi:GATA transcription factor 15-like [Zea mays]|uniref:GATA transcription factor 15-like n=1 Tax=Zea mays TaxID=4577 RepID=UPI001653167C|nr:GATA transcription factor 15-like [Zea mays]
MLPTFLLHLSRYSMLNGYENHVLWASYRVYWIRGIPNNGLQKNVIPNNTSSHANSQRKKKATATAAAASSKRERERERERNKEADEVTVELRAVGFGKEVVLKQRRRMRRRRRLGEEERAAILLMALSSGVVYA